MNERKHFIPSIQDAHFKPNDADKKDSTNQVICQYLLTVSLSLFFSCWGIIIYCHSVIPFLYHWCFHMHNRNHIIHIMYHVTLLHYHTSVWLAEEVREGNCERQTWREHERTRKMSRLFSFFLDKSWERLIRYSHVRIMKTPSLLIFVQKWTKINYFIVFHVIYWRKNIYLPLTQYKNTFFVRYRQKLN